MEYKVIDDLLQVGIPARPGKIRKVTSAIVMHWTAAPNQNPHATVNWWRTSGEYASAHYVIGTDGEIVRAIPSKEVAYHVGSSTPDPASGKMYTDWGRANLGAYCDIPDPIHPKTSPNFCTIGIEMEPLDNVGNFSDLTLNSAAWLVRALMKSYSVPLERITTHHNVVGWKDCPRLWTNQPEKLEEFKKLVEGNAS
jgi:N-acetylmuramoyl-L-alanine amidase